ncbi:GntR family transcriptional regulator [Thalassoroseus pseudoceratinae]|uniref:GntR family transcriptional regulator n=1 Tax=Thalassoroseus pseudoceratinae TaxID=2713176 RepID=UPI001420C876|nr:GntR family transcriptional regulator [Thalassoroseus pseudoceratinae]
MGTKEIPVVRSLQVAEQLRGEILSGRMPEGLRLTEAELVKRFGVGRGAVREAVQRLSLQGLLENRPNCGAVVAPEAPKAIRAVIIPIRRTLEVYALQEIFEDLTDEDFEKWDSILADMRKACEAEDLHAIAEQDIAFHHHLLLRLDQPDMTAIWELLVGRIRSHFRRVQRRRHSDLMEIYEEHRTILESFRRGTLEEAVSLLEEKID